MKINQIDFIEMLGATLSITATEAERFLTAFKRLIEEELSKDNSVNLQGFGQFMVSHRESRLGTNPRTLKPMTIPKLNTPKFKAGEALKNAVKIKQ